MNKIRNAKPETTHWLRSGRLLSFAALALAVFAGGLLAGAVPASAQAGPDGGMTFTGQPAVAAGEFSGDLSKIPFSPSMVGSPKIYRPRLAGPQVTKDPLSGTAAAPAALPVGPAAPMPGTIQNFAGMSFADLCTGGQCGSGFPPDTNGDVGPNHYIQQVNGSVAIYSKTGTLLTAFTEDTLWSGVGSTPCNGNSYGDPITLYDWLADRFVLTWFAFAVDMSGNPVAPFYQCIAASKTANPVAGGWWLYAVQMDTGGVGQPPAGNLNDYFKLGMWNDCMYYAANGFQAPAFNYTGVQVAWFNRADMYAGAAMNYTLGFLPFTNTGTDADDLFTLIPSNNNGKGANAVPAGRPNYFVSESIYVYKFLVRPVTPGPNCSGGSVGAPISVSQAAYNFNLAPVPQPNTATTLDNLGDRLMQKVQYRKVGSAESLWVAHNTRINGDNNGSMQWAQIDVSGGTVAAAPVQQGFHSPDTTLYRWMGSIAADKDGNVALGYSTSNGTSPNFPSIVYAGRLAGDPLNTLPQTETTLIAGGGSQNNSCGGPCDRWGDYSAMSVDPVDDCTFWYTNEYYPDQTAGNAGNWHTRIGSFKFPSCVSLASTTTALASSLNPSTVGLAVTFTATVTGVAPTGTVDFQDGGVSIPSCNAKPLAGGGNSPTAQCVTIGLSAGPHNIVAIYGGDVGNSGSSSAPLVQQVDVPGGALVSNLNPAGSGQLVTFTLTVIGNNPSGSVSFRDDGVNIPGCIGKPLTGVGNTKTAQCMIATLAVGTHPITADYSGDRVNPGGVSNTVNEVITPPPPTTTAVVTSQTPQLKGQPVIFTATVTGTAAPTGTVTFKDGASTITGCSASVLSGGGNSPTATCGTSGLSVGSHSITATYNGDLSNASSVSPTLTQDITCIPGRGCPVP